MKMRNRGARVGYLDSICLGSIIRHCQNEGDGTVELAPGGERSCNVQGMIHPAIKGRIAITSRRTAIMHAAIMHNVGQ